jgi:hypothetical protein
MARLGLEAKLLEPELGQMQLVRMGLPQKALE